MRTPPKKLSGPLKRDGRGPHECRGFFSTFRPKMGIVGETIPVFYTHWNILYPLKSLDYFLDSS